MTKTPPSLALQSFAVASAALFIAALVSLGACTRQDAQTAADIADDVLKVAQVLCLADHARQQHARAFTVQDACRTVEQLRPYLAAAEHPTVAGPLARGGCP